MPFEPTGKFRSLADLYEELTRVKGLLEYYAVGYSATEEDQRSVVQLMQVLKARERHLVHKIIEIESKL